MRIATSMHICQTCQHCYNKNLAYMPDCFVKDYKAAHQDCLDDILLYQLLYQLFAAMQVHSACCT